MQNNHVFPELELLRESFQQGKTRELSWRRSQLLALQAFLTEREEVIAAALHNDLRKSPAESCLTETGYLRGSIRFALKHLKSWMKPHRASVPPLYQPAKAFYVREPYGVVLIIGAWNYPLQLSLAPLVSALAAGNCAVIKPSEHAPHTSSIMAEGVRHYLDCSTVAVVEGGVDEVKALLLQRFDYIFYTGSRAIGQEVMAAAAKQLTPLTLELGGKSPCIVDEHTDIRVAARRIVWAKFLNGGQTCVAPDYVLVHEKREDDLLHLMHEAISDFYSADPEQSPDYPRIINEGHLHRLETLLAGSAVFCGGEINAAERYMAPTIIRGVQADSPLMQAEIFGPLLPVLSYRDTEDALAVVRSKGEPLAIYLFSSDRSVQEKLLRHSRSGSLCINDLLFQAALHTLPFGGVGNSGFGTCHGRAGFETFSFQRSVMHRSLYPDSDVRYPPYTLRKFSILRWAYNWLS